MTINKILFDCNRLENIRSRKTIYDISLLIVQAIKAGNKIILCGNGGSASMCNHAVGELMKIFCFNRSNSNSSNSDEILSKLNPTITALSLCSNISLITAIANDIGYDYIFAQQLIGYGKLGDILIVLSTSGESENCLIATKVAKLMGIKTISFTKMGSSLEKLSGISILFKEIDCAKQQEIHLSLIHYICKTIEEILFEKSGG